MPPKPRIPVVVLSGFLGSGKTTLLNRLLEDATFTDTAVIVNELGEIGLDHLLISAVDDNVLLLESGCLCCGLLNSFRDTLLDLYSRREQQQVPPFRRVIVETTGLADPAPILQVLLRDTALRPLFRLDQLIVVADAALGRDELDAYPEARKQAMLADRLVLSKTDVADASAVQDLKTRLHALNPVAPITTTADPGLRAEVMAGRSDPPSFRRAGNMASQDHTQDADHRPGVRADSFRVEAVVNWSGLAAWVDAVKMFFGSRMLRCKGLVAVEGLAGPVLIQGVQTVFAPPERLASWPDQDRSTRIVCISQGLDKSLLQASLAILRLERGAFGPASLEELLDMARGTVG